MTWVSDYRFSEPLRDVPSEEQEAEQLRTEVVSELSPGHVLYGADFHVIARALPQDEVIVETNDDRVALVHMTWSGHPETAPWPTTEMLDSAEHLEQTIESRY